MSELLTTGQMIDRLKHGEIAVGEVSELGTVIQVIKRESGGIKLLEDGFGERTLMLDGGVVDSVKWRIEPNYVSFEEAVKAWKQGKRIKWISPDRTHEKYIHTKNHDNPLTLYNLTFRDLIEGSWEIKE
ncbi:hypothetical protein [Oceanobacillus jeddahense]|uniref:hypothetical protein n=1 Tax=Oceanobacillus jeddahense TaxID=1462527 RepID=UPI000595DE35|nr:hypothetical protein [Oceanobacillus jeddahense]